MAEEDLHDFNPASPEPLGCAGCTALRGGAVIGVFEASRRSDGAGGIRLVSNNSRLVFVNNNVDRGRGVWRRHYCRGQQDLQELFQRSQGRSVTGYTAP